MNRQPSESHVLLHRERIQGVAEFLKRFLLSNPLLLLPLLVTAVGFLGVLLHWYWLGPSVLKLLAILGSVRKHALLEELGVRAAHFFKVPNPLIQLLRICCFEKCIETLALPVHSNVILELFFEVLGHLRDLGWLQSWLQRNINLHRQGVGLVGLSEELFPQWLGCLLLEVVSDEPGVVILHIAINVKIIEAHLHRLVRQSRKIVPTLVLVLRGVRQRLQIAPQHLRERGVLEALPVLLDLPLLLAAVHGLLLPLLLSLGPRLPHHGDREQVNVRLHKLHIRNLRLQGLVLLALVRVLPGVLHGDHSGLLHRPGIPLLVLPLPAALEVVSLHGEGLPEGDGAAGLAHQDPGVVDEAAPVVLDLALADVGVLLHAQQDAGQQHAVVRWGPLSRCKHH
mmetsp:Transcript_8185/g.20220  ORF Transcript_8185/g.20220 Transcript_8185/m.20220 type:complete len:396 (-) Transcript_8185:2162-3349(-)